MITSYFFAEVLLVPSLKSLLDKHIMDHGPDVKRFGDRLLPPPSRSLE
jgi:hypothetical protein